MTDITLQQIEIFLTVAEQLNLSEAAKDLFLNQSAVSRWIQRLEGSLNAKLFVRNNRGVELTPDGEFLYAELKPIYNRLSMTLRSMRSLYDMPANILRVGCLDSDEVMETLKELVDSFAPSHPDVLVKIEPSNFKDLRENLVLGNLDCVITYYLGFGEYHTLKSKKIKKLESYFAISSHHPLAASDKLPTEQLGSENLFLLTLAEMRDPEERAYNLCKANGFTPKEVKYLPSVLALEMAVRGMRGISINGPNFGRRFGNEIKLYQIGNVEPNQYMILAWREGGCSEIIRQFIDSVPAAYE
jgi:DNA-binding transcriptional LysR family regulator